MQIHRFMMTLARAMAILGGIVLSALILLTCLSVLGRGINTFLHWSLIETYMPGLSKSLLATGVGPILGDYEIVEAGIAFAIFAFMPLCQITAGHATVDLFTQNLPNVVNRVLTAVIEIIFAAVLILISLRLYEGMLSKIRYNETTLLLQLPTGWSYAIALAASVLTAIIGVYMALVRIYELFTARTIVHSAGGDH